MSLALKKVTLENIRSHRYIEVEPAPEGITAISGANGSGKSTIVDSIAWCCFGTKPAGVSKVLAIVREGTDFAEDKCRAAVVLSLDNSTLKVERRIVNKHGAVECEVWEQKADEDEFTQVAGPAVSHAEPYIRKRLRMDEKGFLAAILVQQKQVDQLISATPRERAEVIEKLTGISSVTAALTEARNHHKTIKKTLAVLSFDEDALADLETKLLLTEEEVSEKTVKRDDLRSFLQGSKEDLSARQAVLRDNEAKATAVQELKNTLIAHDATLQALRKELSRLTGEKDEAKTELSSMKGTKLSPELEKKFLENQKSVKQLERQLYLLDSEEKKLEHEAAAHQALLAKAHSQTPETASAGLAKQEAKLEQASRLRKKLQRELQEFLSERKSCENAIEVIVAHEGACPTCLQEVADPAQATANLEERMEKLSARARGHEEKLSQLEGQVEKLEELADKYRQLLTAFATREKVASWRQGAEEERREASTALAALEDEVKAFEKVRNASERFRAAEERYDNLYRRCVAASDEVERLTEEDRKLREEVQSYSLLTDAKYNALRREYEKLAEAHQSKMSDYSALRADVAVLEERLANLRENITRAKAEHARYKELLGSLESSSHSVEIVEEFRENRIKHSVPTVNIYASDLLSRFTEGKFTHLQLDEKFNAKVILADGTARPIGLLSGGELSAAAISLRLAISMLLNAGTAQNMIILDEVLVSQDAERAELILSTIKDICQGQIIMISHGPNTAEIADSVIELS